MTKRVPTFKNEADEAKWWSVHREEFEDYMEPAEDDGIPLHIKIGLNPKAKTRTVALRLSIEDIELARQQAETKGIGYQTLLKMIIHEGLRAVGPAIMAPRRPPARGSLVQRVEEQLEQAARLPGQQKNAAGDKGPATRRKATGA